MDAVALAARELADLLLLVGTAEVERADIGARRHLVLADLKDVEPIRDFLPDVLLRVQRVAALVDVTQMDGRADFDLARVGLLLTGDQLEQGRLARAIGADDANDSTGRKAER